MSDPPIHIPPPYITGFNHSRPEEGFSNLTEKAQELTGYKHPEYADEGRQVRYQARFDYYSLGMVLDRAVEKPQFDDERKGAFRLKRRIYSYEMNFRSRLSEYTTEE